MCGPVSVCVEEKVSTVFKIKEIKKESDQKQFLFENFTWRDFIDHLDFQE